MEPDLSKQRRRGKRHCTRKNIVLGTLWTVTAFLLGMVVSSGRHSSTTDSSSASAYSRPVSVAVPSTPSAPSNGLEVNVRVDKTAVAVALKPHKGFRDVLPFDCPKQATDPETKEGWVSLDTHTHT